MAKPKTKAPKMAALTSEESKPVTKKAATKKPTVVKTDANDLITGTSTEVENLTKAKALKMAPELIEAEGMNDFKLGGVLQRIQEEKWWDGGDVESFKDYIEIELGLPYRKCMYLVNIYSKLVNAGISWLQVKSAGWSKLRFIVDFLTQENVEEWVKRCDEMNSLEIQEYIRTLKASGTKSATEGDETTVSISSLVFKLKPDQKETVKEALKKKREESGTEYDSVAIENICLTYLEGSLGKAKVTKLTEANVKKFLQGKTSEEAAAIVIAVHPDLGDDDDAAEDTKGEAEAA